MLNKLREEVRKSKDPERAKTNAWFFKTGKGEYGEGDKFIGLSVPKCRVIAKKFSDLSLDEIKELLQSEIHEERLIALLILVNKFQKSSDRDSYEIYRFYLNNTEYINNWDLVDSSAHLIIGEYLLDKPRDILYKLARSEILWERRIAIIATLAFIKRKDFIDTFKIAEILLNDKHDLIHKAVGWMLREMGKKSEKDLILFLADYYRQMPRTMLRYSVEKFPEDIRKKYLTGDI